MTKKKLIEKWLPVSFHLFRFIISIHKKTHTQIRNTISDSLKLIIMEIRRNSSWIFHPMTFCKFKYSSFIILINSVCWCNTLFGIELIHKIESMFFFLARWTKNRKNLLDGDKTSLFTFHFETFNWNSSLYKAQINKWCGLTPYFLHINCFQLISVLLLTLFIQYYFAF